MLPNLKILRKEYGISQQKLADAIEVSQQSINQYENHKIEPDIEVLKRLADYFHTSIDYIVGYSNQRIRIENITPYHLSPAEADLIASFRTLSETQKEQVKQHFDASIQIFCKE